MSKLLCSVHNEHPGWPKRPSCEVADRSSAVQCGDQTLYHRRPKGYRNANQSPQTNLAFCERYLILFLVVIFELWGWGSGTSFGQRSIQDKAEQFSCRVLSQLSNLCHTRSEALCARALCVGRKGQVSHLQLVAQIGCCYPTHDLLRTYSGENKSTRKRNVAVWGGTALHELTSLELTCNCKFT
eukprot:804575-Amphidinium_carterae.1